MAFLAGAEPALENLLDAADKAGLNAVAALAEDLIAAEVEFQNGRGSGCACHEHGGAKA